ncbi:isoflavone 4'-O-methyltransferase-like, partial [Neltuma alba]|uniref:isoflavone 4'-O-methyltransferase-like n=1 Tax=Neltuma alba TaxID=207710 RepID=UPI0010A2D928
MDSIIEANPITREFFEAQAHLYKHIFSHINGMVLKCAIQLNIPDIIHNHGQPITIPQLISKLEIHPTKTACVERLVRFLVHNGFLSKTKVNDEEDEEGENEAFVLTPSSTLLVKGLEPNLIPMVLATFHTDVIASLDLLGKWFKGKEKTVSESAFGLGIWDLLESERLKMKGWLAIR